MNEFPCDGALEPRSRQIERARQHPLPTENEVLRELAEQLRGEEETKAPRRWCTMLRPGDSPRLLSPADLGASQESA